MRIRLKSSETKLQNVSHDVLRALLGQVLFLSPDSAELADMEIYLTVRQHHGTLAAEAAVKLLDVGSVSYFTKVTEDILLLEAAPNQLKRLAKLAVYQVVIKAFKLNPLPWGILTGIRPAKIVHRLLDIGWNKDKIYSHLIEGYALSAEKAGELVWVALNNRPFLLKPQEAGRLVSIYIGIPFCPSRCAYCSFPSYPLHRCSNLIEPFLKALEYEIKGVADFIKERGLEVQTIYIGGGTPTTLSEQQLAKLLSLAGEQFISRATVEVTLEAGRPDTLSKGKLLSSKKYGVTRLSINPQTMNSQTLKAIGRNHSPEDIKRSFYMAREVGFKNINMDLIIGLPGETCAEIEKTLLEIEILQPENITVHTMAIKRASSIRENREAFNLPKDEEVFKMLKLTQKMADRISMYPYYLYRQKYMVGPMENKGYTLSGFDCVYNIQVIEERQTIFGLGGGAGTKVVNPADWTLKSIYNPKEPSVYIEGIKEILSRKTSCFN